MGQFVRWECSENPEHRGWRELDEPRGTCNICLAVTRWEEEAESGQREYAPRRLMPEVRSAERLLRGQLKT